MNPHKAPFVNRRLTQEELRTYSEQCMAAWTSEKGEFDPSNSWLQNALLADIHRQSDLAR